MEAEQVTLKEGFLARVLVVKRVRWFRWKVEINFLERGGLGRKRRVL